MQVRIAKEKAIEILEKQRQKAIGQITDALVERQQEINTFRTKMAEFLNLPDEDLAKTPAPRLEFRHSAFFLKEQLSKVDKKLALINKTTRPTVIFTDEDMPRGE